jgi:hypothetical protein
LDFAWDGQFPKKRNWVLRNYAFDTDSALFLDADEFVTDAFVAELQRTLPSTDCVGFWLNYERWFLGKQLKHGDEFLKLALFRVESGEYERIEESSWSGLDMEIHEHPVLEGSKGEIKAPIEHNGYRGLKHYIAKHSEYASWEAAPYLQLMGRVVRAEGGDLKPEASTQTSNLQSVSSSHSSLQSQASSFAQLTPRQQKKYRHIAKWWAAPAYFIRGYF